jgi:hypothetical protein
MDRVVRRVWADADPARRARLASELADDVHRQHSSAHREEIYNYATLAASMVQRALRDRGPDAAGLTPERFESVLTALVRAYQLASAESFDEVNGVTCVAAAVGSGVVMIPLCAALAFSDSALIGPELVNATVAVTAPLGSALGAVAVLYGTLQSSEVGQRLWSLPGMAYLSRKWPGNDHLGFFWTVVDDTLKDEPEWRALRGAEERRANQYLEAFVTLLGPLAPGQDLGAACAAVLVSGG